MARAARRRARLRHTRWRKGDGWTVEYVVCTCGPQQRPFEERHTHFRIAIVTAGSFQYHSAAGRELMTPGALLLGNAGQYFECGHEHGTGDRCISFGYAPDYFENLAADAGIRANKLDFRMLRLPPLRALSPLVVRACTGLDETSASVPWEELSVYMAVQTIQLADKGSLRSRSGSLAPGAESRVTRAVRMIEQHPEAKHALKSLAREAHLSPYHFLRTFERATGVTPHQYVLRARLRRAGLRLKTERTKILDIALDSGFDDVSNFNHAFRAEFGISPRDYRRQS